MDLFVVELAERLTRQAQEAWRRLLNYVGGGIVYVKVNYAERISTLLKSWTAANKSENENEKEIDHGGMNSAEREQVELQLSNKSKTEEKKKGFGKLSFRKKAAQKAEGAGDEEKAAHAATHGKDSDQVGVQSVPTTFPEMFKFNAAVMGFGASTWMNEVLDCFNNIVTNVANSARLQEECDVLALRIAKVLGTNQVNLGEYKSCMLASLRSLLPEDWDSNHEVAWTWLWENIERLLLQIHGKPRVWERAL